MNQCIICGSDEYEVLYPPHKAQVHRIVKCKRCGFMYANPQNEEEISGKVALERIRSKDIDSDNTIIEEEYQGWKEYGMNYLIKQCIQMKDYNKVLEYLETKVKKGKLLEIGAYTGTFLQSAKERGWQVTGIEPMKYPAEYARREYGINMISKVFEHVSLNRKFDAVVCFHVIEHVYDPVLFLNKIRNLLEEKGVFVVETPAYDSIMFKLLRHRERSIRCDGHMFFFTTESLNSLLINSGFRIIKNIKVGRTLTLARILTNVRIIFGHKKFTPFLNACYGFFRLEKISVTINLRDMQRAYCSLS